MNRAIMYSKDNCPYCVEANNLLRARGYEIEKYVIGENCTREQLLEAVPNAKTVPQIFFVNEDGSQDYIGGYDQLKSLFDKIYAS